MTSRNFCKVTGKTGNISLKEPGKNGNVSLKEPGKIGNILFKEPGKTGNFPLVKPGISELGRRGHPEFIEKFQKASLDLPWEHLR